jgi:hypothetical protein
VASKLRSSCLSLLSAGITGLYHHTKPTISSGIRHNPYLPRLSAIKMSWKDTSEYRLSIPLLL